MKTSNKDQLEKHPYVKLHRAINDRVKNTDFTQSSEVRWLVIGNGEYESIRRCAYDFDEVKILDSYLKAINLNIKLCATELIVIDTDTEFLPIFYGENYVNIINALLEKYPGNNHLLQVSDYIKK